MSDARVRIAAIAWTIIFAGAGAAARAQAPTVPRTIVIDGRALAVARQRVQQRDPATLAAVQTALRHADSALRQGPFTVTAKSKTPPSGDKRDYMTQARYFWPDPSKPNGLPYLRKDGETNPASRGGDEEPMGDMVRAVRSLSLGYFFSGDERYATHAALLLRTWFIDPQRRMNPHMPYGQLVPGSSDGRSEGILETRGLLEVIDGLALLEPSRALTAADREAIRAWFAAYTAWLRTSPFGREEEHRPNNHGTWYDAQLAGFSLFIGDLPAARRVLETARQTRCCDAIQPDGAQPHELSRADAMGYSLLNLEALTTLAAVGRAAGIDVWNHRAGDGRGIKAAADFLLPYLAGEWKWTFGKKPPTGHNDQILPLYRILANAYDDPRYDAVVASLPERLEDKYAETLMLLHARTQRNEVAALGAATDLRARVPSASALAEADKRVEARFGASIAAALSDADREALVRKLAIDAQSEGLDVAERFALLSAARRLAASPLNGKLLLAVLALVGRNYQLDPYQELLGDLEKARRAATDEQRANAPSDVVQASLAAVDAAVADRRFEIATKIMTVAAQAARESKDAVLEKNVAARRAALTQQTSEFAAFQRAHKMLSQRPDDPASCAAAGRFLCFVAGDWDSGLPLLSKGNQADLKSLAIGTETVTTDPSDLRRRGDAWWERAQRANGTLKRDFERGARHWYSLAIAELNGSDRTVTEERLEALGGAEPLATLDLRAASLATVGSVAAGSASHAAAATTVPAEPNRAAAIEVLRLDGTVTLSAGDKPPIIVRSAAELPSESFLVRGIDLTKQTLVGDDTLQHFAGLNELETLILDGTKVGDAGLAHVQGLKTLRVLYLDDTKRVTDAGLASLNGLVNLRELRLKRQPVTDAGLVHLQNLPSLNYLRLGFNTAVTDASLDTFAKLPELTFVNATGTAITPAGVERLQLLKPRLKFRLE